MLARGGGERDRELHQRDMAPQYNVYVERVEVRQKVAPQAAFALQSPSSSSFSSYRWGQACWHTLAVRPRDWWRLPASRPLPSCN